MNQIGLLLSTVHASNRIPKAYKYLFEGKDGLLESFQSYDFGAREMAIALKRHLDAPLIECPVSRLLVDCNQAPLSPDIFSKYSAGLDENSKNDLLEEYFNAYREQVRSEIEHQLKSNDLVVHLSIRSFTPKWQGIEREVDVGLIHDSSRSRELKFANSLRVQLNHFNASLRVLPNEPFTAVPEGFMQYLRACWPNEKYLSITIEVNQLRLRNEDESEAITQTLEKGIEDALLSWKTRDLDPQKT